MISREERTIFAENIFVATGRRSNSKLLHPEKSGIEITERGWIKTNTALETTKPNIWAVGDGNGKFLLKHIAIRENKIAYQNAIRDQNLTINYNVIPYAIFTHPEIGGVGLKEREALQLYAEDGIEIGFDQFSEDVKARSMGYEDSAYFAKLIILKEQNKLLGASIIGPEASLLIQFLANVMQTQDSSLESLEQSIFIHPALSKIIEHALENRLTVPEYHQRIGKILEMIE